MLNGPRPTRIEQIDWRSVLPWLRLWDNFAIASRPAHLLLALAMLVGVLIVVLVLGAVVDRSAKVSEIRLHTQPDLDQAVTLMRGEGGMGFDLRQETYTTDDAQVIGQVLARVWREYRFERPLTEADLQIVADLATEEPTTIFFASIEFEAQSIQRLMAAVFNGDWQLGRLLAGPEPDQLSVAGVLRDWCWLTDWWITQHLRPMVVYCVLAYLLWIVFGGALHRSIATQAVTGERRPIGQSFGFMRKRLGRMLLAPLVPVLIMLALGLVPAVVNWMLSIDWLNVVGGLLIPVGLLAALVLAFILVVYVGAMHLILPAIAVDDADVFDAVSRSVHYVLTRPWQTAAYALLVLVHGLVTFAVVGLVAWLGLEIVQGLAMALLGPTPGALEPEASSLAIAALLPEPSYLQFFYWPDMSQLEGGSQVIAGYLVGLTASALTLGVWAYGVSYYVTACTQIYLLLRQSADLVDPSVLDGGVWEAPAHEDGEEEEDGDE